MSGTVYCTCHPGRQEGWTNLGVGTDIEWWVHSNPACHRPSRLWLEGQDPTVLNIFEGGPLDGKAYETQTLVDHFFPILEYKWTPEIRISPRTGAKARVWVHKSSVETQAPAPATEPLTEEVSEQGPTQHPGGTPDMSQSLLERRKALKLSRTVVAEKAGVTVAQLARIESDGKKNTQEEIDAVTAALEALGAADPS